MTWASFIKKTCTIQGRVIKLMNNGLETTKTDMLVERSLKVSPGPHSNLRKPMGAGITIAERAEGCHLWDVDGNEYLDYMMGIGPGILGHSNKDLIDALKDQLDNIYLSATGATQNPWDIFAAEKIHQHVPCAEKVRFLLSGTEAVQLAMRLARAHTGRPVVLLFEGHYNGWMDNCLGGLVSEDPVTHPNPIDSKNDPTGTSGRAIGSLEQFYRIPWNDIELLEAVLAKWGGQVAMIMMEPIVCGMGCLRPRPGYMERVRELCNDYGIVLGFDEIITGFRVCLGGAQAELGVTPDLATFGKALAGGLPVSAVAGKAEIMDHLLTNKVTGSGTFNGYPLGARATYETIRILERDDGAQYRRVDEVQTRLSDGLKEIAGRYGVPMLVQGARGVLASIFTDCDVAYTVKDLNINQELQHRHRKLMLDRGVLMMYGGRWYVTCALLDSDVDKTLDVFDQSMAAL